MNSERSKNYPLRRRAVVKQLLAQRGDALVVAGLGAAAWDVTAAGDTPLNFPLWGAMGAAGLGSLATVATQRPPNLAMVVLDNERYGETGMQLTHTAGGADLGAIAAASGIPICRTVSDEKGLKSVIPQIQKEAGPLFVNIKVRAEDLPLVLPPKDGAYLKDRFRLALLGEAKD
jgi:hypothetical protein